jgi:hypothetical protein
MASLSGNKIKDTYTTLLKLESSTVSGTEQVVEDGAGNDTALKLSTGTVETTGDLKISGTPGTTTSDVKALMLSTSGVVVTRDLNLNPIGTASVIGISPVSATGSNVGLVDAGTLNQKITPANNDKYLLWDEANSEYKYIDHDDLSTSVANSVSAFQPQSLVARPNTTADIPIEATASNAIVFAEIIGDSGATGSTTQATSSVMFGLSTNNVLGFGTVSIARDCVSPIIEEAGYYRITAVVSVLGAGNHNIDLCIHDSVSGTNLAQGIRSVQNEQRYIAEFSALYYFNYPTVSAARFQLKHQSSATGDVIKPSDTFFEIKYLGQNITF